MWNEPGRCDSRGLRDAGGPSGQGGKKTLQEEEAEEMRAHGGGGADPAEQQERGGARAVRRTVLKPAPGPRVLLGEREPPSTR